MESTGSEGWKLFGPSSQRYPSSGRSTVVMLPPGRVRASVTSTLLTPCFVARACAVQRPLMPPPTTTQSADTRAPVDAGASAAPPATAAQRTLTPRLRSREGPRGPLSGGKPADAAVAMAAATISVVVTERVCGGVDDATRCGSGNGPTKMELWIKWAGNRIPARDWFRGYPNPSRVVAGWRPLQGLIED